MRVNELIHKSQFLGTCVNSFDENGECVIPGLYRDVSDFAVHEENASEITSEQFYASVGQIDTSLEKRIGKNREYLHDEDNKIFMIYDIDADIHYFFK